MTPPAPELEQVADELVADDYRGGTALRAAILAALTAAVAQYQHLAEFARASEAGATARAEAAEATVERLTRDLRYFQERKSDHQRYAEEWKQRHPGKEYADIHARWWIGDDIPYVDDTREIVGAIVAALLQEGNAAWDGDATGIISHIVRAQSDRRKAADEAVERLTKALTDAQALLHADDEAASAIFDKYVADIQTYADQAATARADALETAAKIVEDFASHQGDLEDIAILIRAALKANT